MKSRATEIFYCSVRKSYINSKDTPNAFLFPTSVAIGNSAIGQSTE